MADCADVQYTSLVVKEALTDRQRQVLIFIDEKITQKGSPPTLREIASNFDFSSTNAVRSHLTALIRKGYLKKQASLSRGLALDRPRALQAGTIAIVGSVPAGLPIDAIENVEGEIALDLSYLPKGDSFSLRVIGDSMRDAGILDGDMVIVKKQSVAQRGEIVVALINGEATVKRYFPDGDTIRLQPENDLFEPIIVSRRSGEFSLAGKVVGLVRKMS